MLVNTVLFAALTAPPAIDASLIAEVSRVAPGRSFLVGVRMTVPHGWHFYWRNPGDSGTATKVTWKVPTGTFVTPLRWPRPQRIMSGGILSFGYDSETALMVLVTPSRDFRMGDKFTVSATVSWLECKDSCIPQSKNLSLSLPVASSSKASSQKGWLRLQDSTVPLTKAFPISGKVEGDDFTMKFKPPQDSKAVLSGAYFYPIDQEVLENSANQKFELTGGWVKLTSKVFDKNKMPSRVRGVLELNWPASRRSYFEVSVPVSK